jgi:hypothetical protein
MYAREIGQQYVDEGLHTITAEFFTEHLAISGEMSTPEGRLSDHLNGSATGIEIRPSSVQGLFTGEEIDLAGAHAHITKAHLLFVVPMVERDADSNSNGKNWQWTITKRCWAAFGRYTLVGKIHAEVGRDPRLILRSLEEKQFLPFTEVTITNPDGTTRECHTVIVNRSHFEMLALQGI